MWKVAEVEMHTNRLLTLSEADQLRQVTFQLLKVRGVCIIATKLKLLFNQ